MTDNFDRLRLSFDRVRAEDPENPDYLLKWSYDTIEALRREVARLEDKDALGAERDLFETMYKQAEQRAEALERRVKELEGRNAN